MRARAGVDGTQCRSRALYEFGRLAERRVAEQASLNAPLQHIPSNQRCLSTLICQAAFACRSPLVMTTSLANRGAVGAVQEKPRTPSPWVFTLRHPACPPIGPLRFASRKFALIDAKHPSRSRLHTASEWLDSRRIHLADGAYATLISARRILVAPRGLLCADGAAPLCRSIDNHEDSVLFVLVHVGRPQHRVRRRRLTRRRRWWRWWRRIHVRG